MNYGYTTYGASSSADVLSILGLGLFFVIFVGLIALAAAIVYLIASYKVFQKAGRKGYEALIPGHDYFVFFEIAGINPIWILGLVFGGAVCIIPFLGYLAYVGFCIFLMIWLGIRLAKAFGKGTGFGVLIGLLAPIGLAILAFGPATYTAPKKVINKPGEDK